MPPLWRESRFPAERLALQVDPVWRGEGVPHGDGATVLLIAGFLAGDPSLGAVAAWVQRGGYPPRRAAPRGARTPTPPPPPPIASRSASASCTPRPGAACGSSARAAAAA